LTFERGGARIQDPKPVGRSPPVKKVIALVALATAVGVLSLPAGATTRAPENRLRGIVPARGTLQAAGRIFNLTYHGGPVMHTNTTYAIYWVPSGQTVSSKYESLLTGYFQNVAAASGSSSNVYYSDTQYSDATGSIQYASTFGAAFVDTHAFPASGCTDRYTTICLTDAQLQHEIQRVMTKKGWTGGLTHEFFIFTPKGVGSCAGTACAFSYYCAYHSWIGSGSSAIIYANEPYAATEPALCGSGQSPNGDDADSTINVVSHEHNEAITDPLGNAWFDKKGAENGDKCAWNFGTSLGKTTTGSYNQVIGTGKYYLQQEWSNASSGCVLTGT
jgi:hypothetical protein